MTRLGTFVLLVLTSVAACSDGDDLDSDVEAQRAYLGLDESVGASLTLGFAGYNAATSANIPDQSAVGIVGGTLLVSGQVSASNSPNREMRLQIGMVDYSDGPFTIGDDAEEILITYNTAPDTTRDLQPKLTLSLRGIPNGTLAGTLIGDYAMSGSVEGTATLNLSITGMIVDDGTGKVIRAPGTTRVTGTATSGDGVFDVDITL